MLKINPVKPKDAGQHYAPNVKNWDAWIDTILIEESRHLKIWTPYVINQTLVLLKRVQLVFAVMLKNLTQANSNEHSANDSCSDMLWSSIQQIYELKESNIDLVYWRRNHGSISLNFFVSQEGPWKALERLNL